MVLRTIRIAATVTFVELLIAFPFAFWVAKRLEICAGQNHASDVDCCSVLSQQRSAGHCVAAICSRTSS